MFVYLGEARCPLKTRVGATAIAMAVASRLVIKWLVGSESLGKGGLSVAS
jgi:hypothetical protein